MQEANPGFQGTVNMMIRVPNAKRYCGWYLREVTWCKNVIVKVNNFFELGREDCDTGYNFVRMAEIKQKARS